MANNHVLTNPWLQAMHFQDLENNSWSHLTLDDKFFIETMKQEALKFLIFQSVMMIIHMFFVIPSNLFTLIVILKNRSLWTSSNAILVINSSFMTIGSVLILFLRPAYFPFLLYDEPSREVAFCISWWVCTLTFRIGNNR